MRRGKEDNRIFEAGIVLLSHYNGVNFRIQENDRKELLSQKLYLYLSYSLQFEMNPHSYEANVNERLKIYEPILVLEVK